MKKQDFLFIFVLVIIFLPFFVSESIYDWYKSFNAAHGMVMSFIKFGILATLGEMLGLRISAGVYNRKGFGVLPRAIVWGLLGMGINAAMIIFSKGVPQFMEYMGMANAAAIINGEFCLDKLWIALAISVAMNTIFAPVFMTFHKITDTHILDCGGSPRSLLTPGMHNGILSSRKQFLSSGIRHTPSHSSCREKCGCCLQRYWVWCSGYCWLLRLG